MFDHATAVFFARFPRRGSGCPCTYSDRENCGKDLVFVYFGYSREEMNTDRSDIIFHTLLALVVLRESDAPIQPPMARPISSGESSWT